MLLFEETQNVKNIPKELVYEMRYGIPIYYRDYKKVLSGEKTLEEVMGNGYLQSLIINIILKFLYTKLDYHKYLILTNEIGYQWTSKSWRNLDIAIFERKKLDKEGIHNHYIKTSPEIVIEIDTKADLSMHKGFDLYMREKTQDLLDSGVKKVIWFTTKDKKVVIAEQNKGWNTSDWNTNIELFESIILNVGELIREEGIEI